MKSIISNCLPGGEKRLESLKYTSIQNNAINASAST